VKSVERITIALLAGTVADNALEFTKVTSLVDSSVKKVFLNSLIKSVNDLKDKVLSTTDITEGETGRMILNEHLLG